MCWASMGRMPLNAINSPDACVVRPELGALWRVSSAMRFSEVYVGLASETTQMLRGWIVVGGGVVLTVSASVRSSPREDAPKMVVPVWRSTWSIRRHSQPWGCAARCPMRQ